MLSSKQPTAILQKCISIHAVAQERHTGSGPSEGLKIWLGVEILDLLKEKVFHIFLLKSCGQLVI